MKIGIMGGTFDPIHLGHLIAAERAREGYHLDEVWFMPANVPPHKENRPKASTAQRLEMVRRAIGNHPHFRIDDVEIRRGGTSRSIDTVKELRMQHPDKQLYFIIGADMVQYLPYWCEIEALAQQISFLGLQRPGFSLELNCLSATVREKVIPIPMPRIEISSTEIRERRRLKLSIKYLVPDTVQEFIEGNGLYES